MEILLTAILTGLVFVLGGALGFVLLRNLKRGSKSRKPRVEVHTIVDRVRAVGRLVGLEVSTKEITTQTSGGFKWIPSLLISPARLAVIFFFEAQYSVDLSELTVESVRHIEDNRYELTLPPVTDRFLFRDLEAYDIQSGKLLGLIEITGLDADTHNDLVQRARAEAESLFRQQADRYEQQARETIARQVVSLLGLFDVAVQIRFATPAPAAARPEGIGAPTVPEASTGSGRQDWSPAATTAPAGAPASLAQSRSAVAVSA